MMLVQAGVIQVMTRVVVGHDIGLVIGVLVIMRMGSMMG